MKTKAFKVAVYEMSTDKLMQVLQIKTENVMQLRQMCYLASVAIAMANHTSCYYNITKEV